MNDPDLVSSWGSVTTVERSVGASDDTHSGLLLTLT